MQVRTLLENLLFTTVRITTTKPDGPSSGTGFFYTVPSGGDKSYMFLVTNRHVVANATAIDLHLIAGEDDNTPVLGKEEIVSLTRPFVGHPDPEIDVTVVNVSDLYHRMKDLGRPVFLRTVDSDMAATTESLQAFEPIEPVTFIGYPVGLYDAATYLPIVRRGHTASALTVDYGGKPTFLIDASVFPGSSGSPVFLVIPASTPDKHGNITMSGKTRGVFLGIVSSVYQRDVPVLKGEGAPGFVKDSLDIGVVYRASAVGEAVQHYVSKM